MLISSILFAVMVIMFGWIVYSIFSTVRPVEGWMSLMTLISLDFHDVGDADIDLQIPVRHSEYEL